MKIGIKGFGMPPRSHARDGWSEGIRILPAAGLVVLVAAMPLFAARISASQIVERAAKPYERINDYVVDAKVAVESPTIHMPDMDVKIYYKKPDKLHVESGNGLAMLPKQGVVVGNPLREFIKPGCKLALTGSERILKADCYVVTAASRNEGQDVQVTVWIDKKHFLVRQMSTNPEWGPSIRAKLWYSRVGGRYWMPRTTAAQVSLPPLPGSDRGSKPEKDEPTIVTIKFTNYRINTGLSDKIFQKREESN